MTLWGLFLIVLLVCRVLIKIPGIFEFFIRVIGKDATCKKAKMHGDELSTQVAGGEKAPVMHTEKRFEDKALKEIFDTEDGYMELCFSITKHDTYMSFMTSHVLRAQGIHNNRKVGFDLELASHDGKELIMFRSIGQESEDFLHAMNDLYGSGLDVSPMRPVLPVSAFALEGDVSALEDRAVAYKVFFTADEDKDSPEIYGELFVNVELDKKILRLSEKDPVYRKDIVRAFCMSGGK